MSDTYKTHEERLEEYAKQNGGGGTAKTHEDRLNNYANVIYQKREEAARQQQLDASKAAAAERAKRREEKRQAAGVALPSSAVTSGKNNVVMTPGGKNSVLDTVGTFQNIKNEKTSTSGTSGMPSHAPFVSEDAKRENLTTNYQLREPTGAPIQDDVTGKMAGNAIWLSKSDEERAAIIAEANEQAILQQAAAVNKQYDEKMAAYNQANAAYDEWLKKNQSDEVINAMSANPDAPEWAAFKAEGDRLFQETKKYDDEADALKDQADGLHDQALFITTMRRINELLPKMDAETRTALDTYADNNYGIGGLNTNSKEYFSLMAKLGVSEGEARLIAETWKRNKNKEGMENFSGAVKDVTREQGYVGGNLMSIAANAVAPFTGFLAASFAGLSGGRYRSADPNGFLFAPTVMADSAREATAEDIRGENGNIIRAGVADVYNGAMGAADNVLRTMVYGKNANAIMAMDVYQRTVRNASVSGASKEQALALGLASAGLEYMTERVGVDNMLDALEGAKKDAAKKGFMAFLKQTGKNYVEELPQEFISFWGNAAAEAVILRNDSDFNKSVQNYMAQGMDEKNAKAAAWKDLLWDGSLRVAWETGWSTLFQTGFSTAVGKMMSNIEQDTAEGAPPDGTPPVAPAKEAVEAAQQAQTEEATQTPTAEQTVQQVMQGLPGQTVQQTVQQQARETPTAAVEATPPQTQVETQTAEQAQAEPQQQTQELSNAEQGALKLAKLAEVENYPGREQKPNQIYVGKDWLTGKDVFRERRPADDMDDIIRRTRKDVLDKVGTVKAINSGRAHSAVSWAVDDGKITPAQGAKLFIDAYDGGKDALYDLVGEFDALRESAIEKAKKYPEQLSDEQGMEQNAEQDAPVANEETAPSGDAMENSVAETAQEQDSTIYQQDAIAEEESPRNEVKTSAQYTNTYAKTNDAELKKAIESTLEQDPTAYQYEVQTEKEAVRVAKESTATEEKRAAEYDRLMGDGSWKSADNGVAYELIKQLMRDGEAEKAAALDRKRRETVTNWAQGVQTQAKYSRNADEAYSNGAKVLGELTKDNVPKRFWKKQGFDTWKSDLSKRFSEMVDEIDKIDEGNTEAMKDVIRSLARFRNTTAWFGMSKGLTKAAEAGLRNLDYDMAKTVALTQVANIPGDFVKRSVGEATKTIVFQNLLASLTSPLRNLSGNTTSAVIEAVTDSTVGRFFDYLVSKATGVREVGNDIAHGKEFIEGGKRAAEFGSLCVELAIPMESDDKYAERSDKEGGVSHARTFSPKGGIVSRYLSAVEKYYSYAYGVSDLFYEGGSASAVDASLQKLGDTSGLTDESRKKVAWDVGKRRTFKQDGHLTQFAKGMKKVANTLTDKFSPDLGLGDLTMPFARIGANLGTVAADYSGLGVFKGFGEVLALIDDAKKGKKIEPGRQRKAVTDAARGVTGFGIVALMTAMALKGIIKGADDDDWDRAAYEESTGQIGVQFNVSAAIRDLIGKSTEWQKDDAVLSLDFLEPFNAQMLLAAAMAKDIQNNGGVTIGDYVKNSLESVTESILNNPGMELLGDLSDLVNDLQDAENPADYVDIAGETLGGIASEFVPMSAVVRQFAKTIDPVKRDTTGRNVWETALNRVMTGIPFASQTLPAKYGADGEPIARNEPGWLTAVNNFLNPGTATQLKDPAIADYLGALSDRTGNVSVYPESKAPKSFEVDGKEVEVYGKEDRETYHRTYMENIETVYGGLINDGGFTELSDGRQLAVLDYAKKYATATAKKALYPDYKMPAWMDDMEDDPVNTVLLHEYKSNQNDQGDSFSESKHEEMVGGGVSDQHAKDIQAKVAALMPEVSNTETGERYTNVRTVQKLEAIAGMSLTEAEKQAALYAYADDLLDAKFDQLLGKYDSGTVVATYRANLDGGNKEETVKAIKQALGFGATTKAAEAVYEIYNPKPKKDK